MTRKTITYSAAMVFCMLLTIVLFEKRTINQMEHTLIFADGKRRQDSIRLESFKQLVLTHGSCINIKLEKEFLLSDKNNRTVTLNEVLGNKTKYFYYFNEYNCMSCVESYLPFLKKAADKIGSDNIVILGSYEKAKNLFLNLSKYDLNGIPVYNLAASYLMNEKISKVNAPFVFRVDTLLNVSQVYIPEKGLTELSAVYNSQVTL